MTPSDRQRIATITGTQVTGVSPLSGGCITPTYRVDLAHGAPVVANLGDTGGGLAVEGWMHDFLARHPGLPVPNLIHAEDTLLLMAFIPAGAALDEDAQTHAADLLAHLHSISAPAYGFERATVVGGLHQPNPASTRWISFFIEQRLLYMAGLAHQAGRLPTQTRPRIETLAGRLGRWLHEPERPGLIHGDLWHGNILARHTPAGNRIAAFVDPAIYHADPEIELAFTTLFDTFGPSFFQRYRQHRPISPGFFEVRRDLYNLYPLLIHIRLFGGHYLAMVQRTLSRFGC